MTESIELPQKKLTMREERAIRVAHTNELIQIIASHGRQFFYHKETKSMMQTSCERVASFMISRSCLYFKDEYTQEKIHIPRSFFCRWEKFSHGHSLKLLVIDMAKYIYDQKQIPRWKIVIERIDGKGLENNIWGYDVESAKAVREAAYKLPIIEQE